MSMTQSHSVKYRSIDNLAAVTTLRSIYNDPVGDAHELQVWAHDRGDAHPVGDAQELQVCLTT
jgi:hypothetical protein